MIKPETAHPAFDKACHLFGVELRRAPIDSTTTGGMTEEADAFIRAVMADMLDAQSVIPAG